jgi:hypothetical protein
VAVPAARSPPALRFPGQAAARVPIARVDAQQIAIALFRELDERQRSRRLVRPALHGLAQMQVAHVVQRRALEVGAAALDQSLVDLQRRSGVARLGERQRARELRLCYVCIDGGDARDGVVDPLGPVQAQALVCRNQSEPDGRDRECDMDRAALHIQLRSSNDR